MPDAPNVPSADEAPSAAELDFDRADLSAEAARMSCAACKTEIMGTYYAINTRYVCPSCHAGVVGSASSAGSFPGAVLLGSGAAALGAALYYAIVALTGYELGIVAIVVGVVVGKAVRKGAGLRKGAVYRALAMALTYLAMTATYVPSLLKLDGIDTVGQALTLAVIVPVMMMRDLSNALGLIILGIGLYEAWKLSAAPVLDVQGPFERVPSAAALASVAADGTLL